MSASLTRIFSSHGTFPLACLIALALLAFIVLVPFSHGHIAKAEGTPMTAVYVYDRANLILRDEDAANVDQIFYAFALFKGKHITGAHWKGIHAFTEYMKKHPGITPILSVGGWGAEGFSKAASTQKGRDTFVKDVLKLMQKYGFLGVDIDWEYPCSSEAGIRSSADDRDNFTLLLSDMRAGLDALTAQDGVARKLCIAVSGDPVRIPCLDCPAVGALVDQVNLMTYDMQDNAVASHHTPLYTPAGGALAADVCVQAYAEAGIPKSKMMLGAAFYGHRWKADGDAALQQPAAHVDTLPYTEILPLIAQDPSAAHFDEVAQAPYWVAGSVFISYDDERSVAQKSKYVQANGLMGVFAWEYGADDSGRLLAAMRR
ncbi:MAG TPA: glycosyl hydrolase family 18 protein [Candidatus Limiplasma sp.]|nr:glycosyl hydrolase family 18 protein [Candidatus Limiplasma sp.]